MISVYIKVISQRIFKYVGSDVIGAISYRIPMHIELYAGCFLILCFFRIINNYVGTLCVKIIGIFL